MTLFNKLIVFLFQLSVLSFLAEAQDCSQSNPCEVGCCSKFGFCGLGPDYCAEEVCQWQCWRKSQCDPGGYGELYANHTTCPLNVCCSKWGFCGTTDEFCGDNKVTPPNCSNNVKKFSRVVGYYEGWAMGRTCNAFNPEKIPRGVYTHLNFAFAVIDPVTFQVRPASGRDPDLYRRLTDLKKGDPSLKVFIAIGGWTFNDPGPTATTFSDIVSSNENIIAFISSLISFLDTFNFDGVDLDWEYPRAEDRSGRPEDYENFPRFLALLKLSLFFSGYRTGLSITIPASYWYLQHFDIQSMAKVVDFFNVMSYDLHGVWDIENKWVGPYLNAHTNLTEIDEALNLLWRNDIDPDKVVMGLAFYGRASRANSPSCLDPGCTYGSGAPAQPCSDEVGIILNSEIEDVLDRTGQEPTLYEDAAVKVMTWDNTNWVAFDDEETLNMKTDFAADRCLGGVMVWAVSHDTQDAKYSKALRFAAPRNAPSLAYLNDGSTVEYDYIKQCKWTNCGETCPAGYSTVLRQDPNPYPEGEIMLDGQGCDKGVHTLCCPVGEGIPICGWYGHRNGDCQGECPSGLVEVGSNNQHCNTYGPHQRGYQAACCSLEVGIGSGREDIDSLNLVENCEWGSWPVCDAQPGSCSNGLDLLVQSWTGSGGAVCYGGGLRSYCCDNSDEDEQWDNCGWYNHIGPGPKGCKSGCPSDKVRVAMSSAGCKSGAWAYCCSPKARRLAKRSNEDILQWESAISAFLQDPVCPPEYNDGGLAGVERRDVGSALANMASNMTGTSPAYHRRSLGLTRRVTEVQVMEVVEEAATAVTLSAEDGNIQVELLNLWDSTIGAAFSSLTVANIHIYLRNDRDRFLFRAGATAFTVWMLCNLPYANSVIGGEDNLACGTGVWVCGTERRESGSSPHRKRTDAIEWGNRDAAGNPVSGLIERRPHPNGNTWEPNDPVERRLYQEIYVFPNPPCTNFAIRRLDLLAVRLVGPINGIQTEHPLDVQVIAQWYGDAIGGILADETPHPRGRIDPSFLQVTVVHGSTVGLTNPSVGPAAGGVTLNVPQERMMNALGSNRNRGVFVLTEGRLNCIKGLLFSRYPSDRRGLVSADDMNGMLNDGLNGIEEALETVRNVVSLVNYVNDATVHSRLVNVITNFRRELNIADRVHQARGNPPANPRQHFEAWIASRYDLAEADLRVWARFWTDAARQMLQTYTGQRATQLTQDTFVIDNTVATARFSRVGFLNPV